MGSPRCRAWPVGLEVLRETCPSTVLGHRAEKSRVLSEKCGQPEGPASGERAAARTEATEQEGQPQTLARQKDRLQHQKPGRPCAETITQQDQVVFIPRVGAGSTHRNLSLRKYHIH